MHQSKAAIITWIENTRQWTKDTLGVYPNQQLPSIETRESAKRIVNSLYESVNCLSVRPGPSGIDIEATLDSINNYIMLFVMNHFVLMGIVPYYISENRIITERGDLALSDYNTNPLINGRTLADISYLEYLLETAKKPWC